MHMTRVIGGVQGFYAASSQGRHQEDHRAHSHVRGPRDTAWRRHASFFGVHRMARTESHIAIIGGTATGKYEHAKGFAAI
ncbi:unnamed protein product [Miscanthus lutarioriparius]|uniref:Uncharacterized protein n=1 Tax=Miscanthus lutarioriparius TaxID=422564 RepID=A0A811RFL6_9POAL|nr:unnamed protein product [Miscanthus lutarioriparius]